ncbi:MAG: hypothetical protein HQK54_03820 [Oligoflexales bacterium]|nr:hypothetical protein [Oligoflexales bacterium]
MKETQPHKVIEKIKESAKFVSIDVGIPYFKVPDLSAIEDEKCLSLLLSDPSEKYCASTVIKSPQITFTIKVLFSIHTAHNLLKSKYPIIGDHNEKEVALDIVSEYVNIFSGSFKILFKYPEKFNFVSTPVLVKALSVTFEPSSLISRWFLASNEREIILQPFLFYETISDDIFQHIVLHELGYKEVNGIEVF